MAVDPVSQISTQQWPARVRAAAASASASLNYDNFLKLLVAQMKNQDPTEPMDASQQISQLATFSQVEQTIKTNIASGKPAAERTSISQAVGLYRQDMTSADGTVTGIVKEVTSIRMVSLRCRGRR